LPLFIANAPSALFFYAILTDECSLLACFLLSFCAFLITTFFVWLLVLFATIFTFGILAGGPIMPFWTARLSKAFAKPIFCAMLILEQLILP
jgi:hypothetical protein